ncbi:hypothetical protein CYMTET_25843 [Cymbomonas tetramitiformis]|uniref:Amino acid transporter transmembrane domain-containing protein n=1 Tax=Cymbomonas tetramitiformis TaxID=36881 RepID=A0AAE0FSX6_9CHLO|nr:hypothetical protein CYMTET_25843 [Cymbomonas tetramitiformis]
MSGKLKWTSRANAQESEEISRKLKSHDLSAKNSLFDMDMANAAKGVPNISALTAAMHLIRSNLGAGVLNLPWAFAQVGWEWGLALSVVIALQGVYCMHLLASVNLALAPGGGATFTQLADVTLGKHGRYASQICIFALQTGVCCVFVELVSTNLRPFFPDSINEVPVLGDRVVTLLVAPAFLALAMLQTIRDLTWLTFMGNALMALTICSAIATSVTRLVERGVPAANASPRLPSNEDVSLFIGSMFFAFEGMGTVMPVANAYGDSRKFLRILSLAMGTLATIFIATGLLCSLSFEKIDNGSIVAYLQDEVGGW